MTDLKRTVLDLLAQGRSASEAARASGVPRTTVRRWRKEANLLTPDIGSVNDREIDEGPDSLTARFTSTTPITTKEEAAAKAGIDLTQWQVERVKTKAYQVSMKEIQKNGQVRPIVQQLWGITVSFIPKRGPSTTEAITALVDGVLNTRPPAPFRPLVIKARPRSQTMQSIFIADPHLSKLCWPESTGGEAYDINIARKLVLGGVQHLVAQDAAADSRTLVFLGDYFHYDTLAGTTTAGTMQDRDSRIQKMLEVGAEVAMQAILYAARLGEVQVILVPGNHDTVLTWALQRILQGEFRHNKDVQIDGTYTKRKVQVYGKNLFMYDHGERRKTELPKTLSVDHPKLWGESIYREIHTGHLHHEAEKFFGTQTEQGCLVYTHPSMSPPDQWHSDEQYIGSTRGMKAFTYSHDGGQIASFTALPRMLL